MSQIIVHLRWAFCVLAMALSVAAIGVTEAHAQVDEDGMPIAQPAPAPVQRQPAPSQPIQTSPSTSGQLQTSPAPSTRLQTSPAPGGQIQTSPQIRTSPQPATSLQTSPVAPTRPTTSPASPTGTAPVEAKPRTSSAATTGAATASVDTTDTAATAPSTTDAGTPLPPDEPIPADPTTIDAVTEPAPEAVDDLTAVAEPPPSGGLPWLWIAIAVVGIAIAAAIGLAMRGKATPRSRPAGLTSATDAGTSGGSGATAVEPRIRCQCELGTPRLLEADLNLEAPDLTVAAEVRLGAPSLDDTLTIEEEGQRNG